ncbi:glutathione S-transferase family protein [Nannocystaceae bacterium ST9]
MIRLFGTVTSPYVRRVRVVAHELGLACELVDTATDMGQNALRERSPIWKVPAAEIEETLIFDSHAITELLLARHGAGKLAPLAIDDIAARNAIAVIDGALDALINCLYLSRDGLGAAQSPYLAKQHERAAASLVWLENRVEDGWLSSRRELGLPEIALVSALGWIRFRDMARLDGYPALLAIFERLEARESFASTRPH